MKKLFMIGITGMLSIGLLTGCQQKKSNTDNTQKSVEQNEDNQEQSDKEPIDKEPIDKAEVTLKEAEEIALKDGGEILLSHEDYEDGIASYDVEVVKGDTKYEYEITKQGETISVESEPYQSVDSVIPANKAKKKMLKHAGGGTVEKCELDDGNTTYEIKVMKKNKMYEGKIDAMTGKVLYFHLDD